MARRWSSSRIEDLRRGGDGTTTATDAGQAIVQEGAKYVAAGANRWT